VPPKKKRSTAKVTKGHAPPVANDVGSDEDEDADEQIVDGTDSPTNGDPMALDDPVSADDGQADSDHAPDGSFHIPDLSALTDIAESSTLAQARPRRTPKAKASFYDVQEEQTQQAGSAGKRAVEPVRPADDLELDEASAPEPEKERRTQTTKANETPKTRRPRTSTAATPGAAPSAQSSRSGANPTFRQGVLTDAETKSLLQAAEFFREANNLEEVVFNDMVQEQLPRSNIKADDAGRHLDHKSRLRLELWNVLCAALPDRPRAKTLLIARKHFHNFVARGTWTEDQDRELVEAYRSSPGQWRVIADAINRHQSDVRDRWRQHHAAGDDNLTHFWYDEEEVELVVRYMDAIEWVSRHRTTSEGAVARPDWAIITAAMSFPVNRPTAQRHLKAMGMEELIAGKEELLCLQPGGPCWTLEKMWRQISAMEETDKLALVLEIRDYHRAAKTDDQVAWSEISRKLFEDRWSTWALQLLWQRVRQSVSAPPDKPCALARLVYQERHRTGTLGEQELSIGAETDFLAKLPKVRGLMSRKKVRIDQPLFAQIHRPLEPNVGGGALPMRRTGWRWRPETHDPEWYSKEMEGKGRLARSGAYSPWKKVRPGSSLQATAAAAAESTAAEGPESAAAEESESSAAEEPESAPPKKSKRATAKKPERAAKAKKTRAGRGTASRRAEREEPASREEVDGAEDGPDTEEEVLDAPAEADTSEHAEAEAAENADDDEVDGEVKAEADKGADLEPQDQEDEAGSMAAVASAALERMGALLGLTGRSARTTAARRTQLKEVQEAAENTPTAGPARRLRARGATAETTAAAAPIYEPRQAEAVVMEEAAALATSSQRKRRQQEVAAEQPPVTSSQGTNGQREAMAEQPPATSSQRTRGHRGAAAEQASAAGTSRQSQATEEAATEETPAAATPVRKASGRRRPATEEPSSVRRSRALQATSLNAPATGATRRTRAVKEELEPGPEPPVEAPPTRLASSIRLPSPTQLPSSSQFSSSIQLPSSTQHPSSTHLPSSSQLPPSTQPQPSSQLPLATQEPELPASTQALRAASRRAKAAAAKVVKPPARKPPARRAARPQLSAEAIDDSDEEHFSQDPPVKVKQETGEGDSDVDDRFSTPASRPRSINGLGAASQMSASNTPTGTQHQQQQQQQQSPSASESPSPEDNIQTKYEAEHPTPPSSQPRPRPSQQRSPNPALRLPWQHDLAVGSQNSLSVYESDGTTGGPSPPRRQPPQPPQPLFQLRPPQFSRKRNSGLMQSAPQLPPLRTPGTAARTPFASKRAMRPLEDIETTQPEPAAITATDADAATNSSDDDTEMIDIPGRVTRPMRGW
jgi:hypothetical protein